MNITIVGGGFGGAKAALELSKDSRNSITLISDKPDFQYYPALYKAATGHSHIESWMPLKEIFSGKENVHIQIDTIVSVDPQQKTLTALSGSEYSYETCILALGAVTTYFGIEGLDDHAYGIKSADEITRLKKHLYEDIAERHVIDKHYVIIGAGPTGVELAAALGSYITRICKEHGIQRRNIHVDLIEAAQRVLPKMSEKTSRVVEKRLKKLKVQVRTHKVVQSATVDQLMVSGKPIKSHTVIWTSGVANHPFYEANAEHFEFAPNKKIIVNEYMQTSCGIYVIGDNAATPYSGLAQTALHDALFVSANIKLTQDNKPLKKYQAVMPPVVVPVGGNWAVFEWKKIRLHGWMASLIRKVADLIGYSDVLPLGQALGVWASPRIMQDDFFNRFKDRNSTSK